MARNSIVKILLGTSALAGVVATAAPALSEEIETVVVTARQRSEDIEKVPSQVTAFTAGEIEAKGIKNPADFLSAVPNVTFISTRNGGTSFVVMLGIGPAGNPGRGARTVVA